MYKTKTISYDSRVYAFWTIAALSLLALAIYIFAINATIRNTVARRDMESQVSTLAARQSSLEFAYIEAKNKINLETALAYGFKEVESPTYISRTGATALTYNR